MGRPLGDNLMETRDGTIVTYSELQRTKRARRSARSDSQIVSARVALHPDGLKRCKKCQHQLPFHAFRDSRREADGLAPHCYGCRPSAPDQEAEDA